MQRKIAYFKHILFPDTGCPVPGNMFIKINGFYYISIIIIKSSIICVSVYFLHVFGKVFNLLIDNYLYISKTCHI